MSELWHRGRRGFVRDFLTACLGPDWPGRPGHAQRLLEDLPEEGALERPRARARDEERPRTGVDKSGLAFPPPSGPTQRERRAVRNDRVWDLRNAVLKRAKTWFANRCEWCRVGEPVHMRHVLKGSDKVAEESEATGAALCSECDTKTEQSPSWARVRALEWARQLAREARRRTLDDLAAHFDRTAEILEGKIALAEAQARPLVTPEAP